MSLLRNRKIFDPTATAASGGQLRCSNVIQLGADQWFSSPQTAGLITPKKQTNSAWLDRRFVETAAFWKVQTPVTAGRDGVIEVSECFKFMKRKRQYVMTVLKV